MTTRSISEITRRNLFDELRLSEINWSGRLGESDFLARVFDLASLPSHDHRCSDMGSDVHLHRERFRDWGDDWVYDDSRLNLLHGPDDKFLQFLCQMVHPIVRLDEAEAAGLAGIFNKHLAADGYEIVAQTFVSGRAIYAARRRVQAIEQRTQAARRVADELSSEHIAAQITRMETSVETDPALAIGSAKEFVESICKGILAARSIALSGAEDIQKLVKLTRDVLDLSADRNTEDTLRKTLSGLATITQGIAELRGQLGSGHGHHPSTPKPPTEVARLAVHAATSLAIYLYEVHRKSAPALQLFPLHGGVS